MRKVVYNDCYGGFELSPLAVKRYYELKYPDVTLYFYRKEWDDNGSVKYIKTSPELDLDLTILSKDMGESFIISVIGEYPWQPEDHIWCHPDRADPALVQTVEELGEKANGWASDLKIETVEGKYRICEYDGAEWIETPESIEWL